MAGEWEARTNVHGVGQPGDAGLSAQPILLHLPTLPPGLAPVLKVQSLVDQWYAQEAICLYSVAVGPHATAEQVPNTSWPRS